MPDTLDATGWPDRPAFEAWWRTHVIQFNALSVTDPPRWERIARAVERFQQEHSYHAYPVDTHSIYPYIPGTGQFRPWELGHGS